MNQANPYNNSLPPKPPKSQPPNQEILQPDPIIKDISIKAKRPLQPLIVSYEVKELRNAEGNTKETARTNDLLLSEYMVKPLQKNTQMQSLDGVTIGGSSLGKSTKLFSTKTANPFANQFDKDANKQINIDELNQLLANDINEAVGNFDEVVFEKKKSSLEAVAVLPPNSVSQTRQGALNFAPNSYI